MFIRCHGAQPDDGVVSRLSTFSTISAPVIHSCAVLDQILSAFVYPLRSVVTHVHLKTLTSHLSLSLCYNLRAKMPSVINLTDGLELLSLRLTLTAHCDASSTILYGIIWYYNQIAAAIKPSLSEDQRSVFIQTSYNTQHLKRLSAFQL